MAIAAPRVLSRQQDEPARMAWLIAIGTIPVVIVGLLLRDVEDALRRPAVAGVTLAVGGVLLLWADRASRRVRQAEDLGTGEAFALGWAQSAALVPGVSRSGATLTVALFLGLRRDAAARFSFLLGVPAIAAAAAHEGSETPAGASRGRDRAAVPDRHRRVGHRRVHHHQVLPALSGVALAFGVRVVPNRAISRGRRVAHRWTRLTP